MPFSNIIVRVLMSYIFSGSSVMRKLCETPNNNSGRHLSFMSRFLQKIFLGGSIVIYCQLSLF